MSASLSPRQGPAARIAGWQVDESARGRSSPNVAAATTLESAFALASLSRAPHLLGRPLLRPLHRHVLAVEGMVDGVGLREYLDHVEQLEPRLTQEPNEIASCELELGLGIVGPVEAVQPQLGALQALLDLAVIGHAEDRER